MQSYTQEEDLRTLRTDQIVQMDQTTIAYRAMTLRTPLRCKQRMTQRKTLPPSSEIADLPHTKPITGHKDHKNRKQNNEYFVHHNISVRSFKTASAFRHQR